MDSGAEIHKKFMQQALNQAHKSPPKPTNFCVGAILVLKRAGSPEADRTVSGYTLECEGNTHAEQCCFIKLAAEYGCREEDLEQHLPGDVDCVLYVTMEPCNKRSVGNSPCVERILRLKRKDGGQIVRTVYVGVREPETFVGENLGRKRLEDAGIEVVDVCGFEEDILRVATAGHNHAHV